MIFIDFSFSKGVISKGSMLIFVGGVFQCVFAIQVPVYFPWKRLPHCHEDFFGHFWVIPPAFPVGFQKVKPTFKE